jgi:RNase P/RNase MRP subunit p29
MAQPNLQGEFIGHNVEVIISTNKSNEGIKGTVMDETFHTFKVLVEGNIKVLLKKASTFAFFKNSSKKTIVGTQIEFRPEDRIKKAK